MKNRIISVLCVLAVILVFALTAQTFSVGAEDTTSKPPTQGEPYVEPDTSSTTTTKPPMPTTTTTTKKEEPKPSETVADPTTTEPPKTTEKPPVSESDTSATSATSTTVPGSETETTKVSPKPTTTKKVGDGTTTGWNKNYTTTRRVVPSMTVPVVENTTIEGSTLNPVDAYFERISGSNETYPTFSETQPITQQSGNEPHEPLPTIAIVAICLGGIALVTVLLTAIFAIRNKRSGSEADAAPDYELDAYDANTYAPQDESRPQASRPQVDESDSFTVVSLDDNDYSD